MTYFFVSLAILVIGILIIAFNIFRMLRNFGKTDFNIPSTYFLGGVIATLGGLATLITGIMWLVTYLKT